MEQASALARRVLQFARLLRSAGMPVGSDRVMLAWRALGVSGLASRQDLRHVLAACLVDDRAHQTLFDLAFELCWSGGVAAAEPDVITRREATSAQRRLADALADALANALADASTDAHAGAAAGHSAQAETSSTSALTIEKTSIEGSADASARERLQQMDFEAMSDAEWREAQRLLARLPVVFEPLRTRRWRVAPKPGSADWRTSLRAMARQGGELASMRWRAPRTKSAPLLLLADISGSMSRYSRMLIHLAHLLAHARGRGKVESFVFGTRLTRTTRLLEGRDVDYAMAQVQRGVADWSGGTRIAASLHEFNQRWSRRVLDSHATVLLVSDGLEQGDTRALSEEMARLRMNCRRIVWLNPLLRFAAFEPRAGGIQAMLPHVDRLLPAHNLVSLSDVLTLLAHGH